MKKFAALLPVVFLGLATMAGAYDNDPGSLLGRWSGGRSERGVGNDPNAPLFYKPTQRFYGPGYTISYRYVPVYQVGYATASPGGPMYVSSNFPTERFHIATEEIPAYGSNPPRLTVKDPKSAAPRAAVTSIVRKKTSNRAPAIVPSTTETPAVAPVAAPVVAPAEAPKP